MPAPGMLTDRDVLQDRWKASVSSSSWKHSIFAEWLWFLICLVSDVPFQLCPGVSVPSVLLSQHESTRSLWMTVGRPYFCSPGWTIACDLALFRACARTSALYHFVTFDFIVYRCVYIYIHRLLGTVSGACFACWCLNLEPCYNVMFQGDLKRLSGFGLLRTSLAISFASRQTAATWLYFQIPSAIASAHRALHMK